MKGRKIQSLFVSKSEEEGQGSSKHELRPQSEFVSVKHEVLEFDNEQELAVKIRESEHCYLRDSRSSAQDKGKYLATSAAGAIQDYEVHDQITEKNASTFPKSNAGKDNCTETKEKGKAFAPPDELEIPLCPPPANPDQMAILNYSNTICIDPEPFDPATYEARDFYVADASGTKKPIPDSHIIRWRKVENPDGTTSVESNARFVAWSDGSLQLYIGDDAFDVNEEDAKEAERLLYLEVTKGIYLSQGRISKDMKIIPSTLSFQCRHHFSTNVESSHEKVDEAQQKNTDAEPEKKMEEKRKELENICNLGTSSVKVTQGLLHLPKDKKVEPKHGRQGNEVEGPIPNPDLLEGMGETEDEEPHDSSEIEEVSDNFSA